jgi:hypothetical protein
MHAYNKNVALYVFDDLDHTTCECAVQHVPLSWRIVGMTAVEIVGSSLMHGAAWLR